eukprot:1443570-Prymnesium_polylepis.1
MRDAETRGAQLWEVECVGCSASGKRCNPRLPARVLTTLMRDVRTQARRMTPGKRTELGRERDGPQGM